MSDRAAVKYIDNQYLLIAFLKMEDSVGVSTAFFFFILTSGIAHSGPVKSVDTSWWGVSRASAWPFSVGAVSCL